MAKTSKKTTDVVSPASPSAASVPTPQNGDGATKPANSTQMKTPASKSSVTKPAGKPRATTPPKPSTMRKPRAAGSKKPSAAEEISEDRIRLRAYFISEDRMRLGRPGSSADDWLEARRQLEEEANRRA